MDYDPAVLDMVNLKRGIVDILMAVRGHCLRLLGVL